MNAPRHVVLATAGSLGDLHPFLALGSALQRRGHRATVATQARHADAVRAAGLAFRPMRPDPEDTPQFHARYMHPTRGGEFVYRHHLAPAIRDSHADLLRAVEGADLLLSQSLMALAAPLVARQTGIAWISAVLQPMAFFSVHERPNYLPLEPLAWLCGRSPALHEKVFFYVKQHTETWIAPVRALRRELGLPDTAHPMYEGQHSPARVLALFSPLLGAPQPDWPQATLQTGAALYQPEADLPQALQAFLARGGAPLAVFTLSSASSNDAGDFYRDGLQAARALGLRALLIMGGLARGARLPEPLPDWALRIDYAAFEAVFPLADVIVHSGGVATCEKALRAGKPQVVVPHAHDQQDNALRLAALGVAIACRQRAGGARLRQALARAVSDPGLRTRAAALGERARQEDGLSAACDEIERQLDHA